VSAPDAAGSHVNGRHDDFVRSELRHRQAYRRHVRHRVHGPDLVEVDLFDRFSVRGALRLRDQTVYRHDVVFDLFRQIQMVPDDVFDPVQGGMAVMMAVVMLVVMVMIMIVLVLVFMLMFMLMFMIVLVFMLVLMLVLVAEFLFMLVVVVMLMVR
jgi:hypothetical protein